MTSAHAHTRQNRILWLVGICIGLWVILGLTNLTFGAPSSRHADMGDPVLSGFSETRVDAQRIRFTLADESYTLQRTAAGWPMEETGGYPGRLDSLAELASGLETLTYGEKRTDDAYKHDRIGLGDPIEGGNGALVEVFGIDADLMHSLIVGRKGDQLYVRDPGETQTFPLLLLFLLLRPHR